MSKLIQKVTLGYGGGGGTPVSQDKSNFIFFQTHSTKTSFYKIFLILISTFNPTYED
jgi:hypothetical protein